MDGEQTHRNTSTAGLPDNSPEMAATGNSALTSTSSGDPEQSGTVISADTAQTAQTANTVQNTGAAARAGTGQGILDSARRLAGIPEPTSLTVQDLLDLPGQILPAETVHHLKNAGREALLAVYSLWRNIDKGAKGDPGARVRKHIEVE